MADARTFDCVLTAGSLGGEDELSSIISAAGGAVGQVARVTGDWDLHVTATFPSDGAAKLALDQVESVASGLSFWLHPSPNESTRGVAEDYLQLVQQRQVHAAEPEWHDEGRWWRDVSGYAGSNGEFDRMIRADSDELGLVGLNVDQEPGWMWNWAWVWDDQVRESASIAADPPQGVEGAGRWIWTTVRTIWRVSGTVGRFTGYDPRVHVALWVTKKLYREYVDYGRRHPSEFEVQRRQALQANRVRERLTTTGPAPRRAYFKLYYARIDRANALAS